MNIIKNINKLKGTISDADIQKLEAAALLHQKNSNITFKIIGVDTAEVTIRTEQGEHLSGNYADAKTLVTRTRELFGHFLPQKIIHDHAIPYNKPVTAIVTPQWLSKKMLDKGVRIKDIALVTGIPRADISAWLNEKEAMTALVKSMFYFYFTGPVDY